MPSVEMRRSTRVFVPKAKEGELVRVLRSGRRLWVDSDKTKNQRTNLDVEESEWFPIITNHETMKAPDTPPQKEQEAEFKGSNGRSGGEELTPEANPELMEVENTGELEEVGMGGSRVIRYVYSRKRKSNLEVAGEKRPEKKFGLHYVRRKKRKGGDHFVEKGRVELVEFEGGATQIMSIVNNSNCCGSNLFPRLLESLLRHLVSRRTVGLEQLSTFLVSHQISSVFVSFGVRFFWNCLHMGNIGVCRINGERDRIPSFTVDFSAIPLWFLYVHVSLSLRSLRQFLVCVMELPYSTSEDEPSDYLFVSCDEPVLDANSRSEYFVTSLIAPKKDDSKGVKILVAALEANKVGTVVRNVQYRSGVQTRSASKRRRRSLRSRRARNPSHFVMQKVNGPPVMNCVTFKKKVGRFPASPKQELRRSARNNPESMLDSPKSCAFTAGLSVDVDSQQCCLANILVVETDKCYRVEGAEIVLDLSATNEWVLSVRKDGLTRYSLKVQKEMRPHSINRFTHAVVWAGETGWKLEFPNRKDWIVFKELYKVCGERNFIPPSPVVKFIPIPEVLEVAIFRDSTESAFERPESYIRMAGDELSRILLRRAANYDMDAEDEEWLGNFNRGLDESNLLSDESFELLIDAFEKASYYSPEDVRDEKAAANVCPDLVNPEVVEQVYRYWMKRRMEKRAPLLRVFELNEQKRTEVLTRPVLRKKRSLKRTSYLPMLRGRGKDNSVLQALAAEQTHAEQRLVLRLQEARAAAVRSVDEATLKRQNAQFLMENADLAIYRATMALRIAEAAGHIDINQAAAHFLD